ncbi:MAG: N-acetylmuramoyl-L-alanine amidase [Deltaproteobacteria bacterium]|nr:N-acetylmuramoyl-L-alanine amidase [Deltaproteobacteria bacterium]
MKVVRHRLHDEQGEPLNFVRSPNQGDLVDHQLLVMHYTAGSSAESSVSWLTNAASRASAHVVIGRDGSVTQLVPFDRIAFHAGKSEWLGRKKVNEFSLGIELDNAGRLFRHEDGWRAWFGGHFSDAETLEATHRFESEPSGWHLFAQPQIEAAIEVATTLITKYNLWAVVGHDDVSPFRKVDPGPVFPMESFRSRVLGREDDAPELFETTTALNIRTGPGTEFGQLEGSPLPEGTEVEILTDSGNWRFVDVQKTVGGIADLEGWVHGRYLRRVE